MPRMNIALILTIARIGLIPLLCLAYYFSGGGIVSASIFALAAFTDWIDGLLARQFNMRTSFGAFLDPVADKLLVVITLVMVTSQYHSIFVTLPACVIISREIIVSSLREWMAELGKSAGMRVTFVAKIKTTVQMAALVAILLYHPSGPLWILWLGMSLMYIAVALTLWSMGQYIRIAMPDLTSSLKR